MKEVNYYIFFDGVIYFTQLFVSWREPKSKDVINVKKNCEIL